MTAIEMTNALASFGLSEDVWLNTLEPWNIIGTVCTQSTYHIYLNKEYNYRFNSTNETLEIALLDTNNTIKRVVDYSNIVCLVGTYKYLHGAPIMKGFR